MCMCGEGVTCYAHLTDFLFQPIVIGRLNNWCLEQTVVPYAQVVHWGGFFMPTPLHNHLVIALPGELDTVAIGTSERVVITTQWVAPPDEKKFFQEKEVPIISPVGDRRQQLAYMYNIPTMYISQLSGFANISDHHKFITKVKTAMGVFWFISYERDTSCYDPLRGRWAFAVSKFPCPYYTDEKIQEILYQEAPVFDHSCAGTSHCPNMVVDPPHRFSWTQAMRMCRGSNRSLPLFFSRGELQQFLNGLKILYKSFPLEAVFMGWKEQQVANHFYLEVD